MVPPNDGNSQNMLLLPDAILGGFTKPRESRISETSVFLETGKAHANVIFEVFLRSGI